MKVPSTVFVRVAGAFSGAAAADEGAAHVIAVALITRAGEWADSPKRHVQPPPAGAVLLGAKGSKKPLP